MPQIVEIHRCGKGAHGPGYAGPIPCSLTSKVTHDCRIDGCYVSLNGIALEDIEIYVLTRTGSVDVVETVRKGAAMPRHSPGSPMPNLQKRDRPWTRRKVM